MGHRKTQTALLPSLVSLGPPPTRPPTLLAAQGPANSQQMSMMLEQREALRGTPWAPPLGSLAVGHAALSWDLVSGRQLTCRRVRGPYPQQAVSWRPVKHRAAVAPGPLRYPGQEGQQARPWPCIPVVPWSWPC